MDCLSICPHKYLFLLKKLYSSFLEVICVINSDFLGFRYWRQKEPNNEGEADCVLITYPKNEQCWNDAKCFIEAPWICEKKGSV